MFNLLKAAEKAALSGVWIQYLSNCTMCILPTLPDTPHGSLRVR